MHRTTRLARIALRAVSAGCLAALAAAAHARVPEPAPCTEVGHGGAEVAVDREGNASPDCLEIVKNKVDVTWSGGDDVATLVVRFDLVEGKKPLDDPECSGATCRLDKLKAKKKGSFKYSVTVTRGDGTSKTVDPKLIIKQ